MTEKWKRSDDTHIIYNLDHTNTASSAYVDSATGAVFEFDSPIDLQPGDDFKIEFSEDGEEATLWKLVRKGKRMPT